MAEKQTEPTAIKSSRGKLKLILLIIIILLVLAAGGGAVYYFLLRGPAEHAEETTEAHDPDSEHKSESASGHGSELAPLLYHPLDPVTVNISSPGPVRFLRLNITIVTRDQNVVAAVDKHLPMIRNDILTHLSGQSYGIINTPEGKDTLREELKGLLSGILTKAHEPAEIKTILFTELVMQ